MNGKELFTIQIPSNVITEKDIFKVIQVARSEHDDRPQGEDLMETQEVIEWITTGKDSDMIDTVDYLVKHPLNSFSNFELNYYIGRICCSSYTDFC